jgi:hypothetical protein
MRQINTLARRKTGVSCMFSVALSILPPHQQKGKQRKN